MRRELSYVELNGFEPCATSATDCNIIIIKQEEGKPMGQCMIGIYKLEAENHNLIDSRVFFSFENKHEKLTLL